MAHIVADRVQETASNKPNASTAFDLPNTGTTGHIPFDTVMQTNDTCFYLATDGTLWEVGFGTFTVGTPDTLARTTILSSSDGDGTAVDFSGGGDVLVSIVDPAQQIGRSYNTHQSITPGGRLTLATGDPAPTTDQTAKTSIFYTPYLHDTITLFDGTRWVPTVFSDTELALGTLTAYAAYDVFAYLNSGALALELLEWKTSTVTMTIASPCVITDTAHGMSNGDKVVLTTSGALPTGVSANTSYFVVNKATDTYQIASTYGGTAINSSGSQSGTHTAHQSRARGTAITLQDGRYCKSGDKTRLFLGSIFTTATTTTEDSLRNRYVFNFYNRLMRTAYWSGGNNSKSYTTGAWQNWNNSATDSLIQIFNGDLVTQNIQGSLSYQVDATGTGVAGGLGLHQGNPSPTISIAGSMASVQYTVSYWLGMAIGWRPAVFVYYGASGTDFNYCIVALSFPN